MNDARTNKNQDAQEAPGKVRKCSQTKNRVEMSNKSPCLWAQLHDQGVQESAVSLTE